jgi:PPOX class probable F420-dependent enzyme
MAVFDPPARELLESPALGHLVTLNPDGSPQVSCVWVGQDGDEIVCAHLSHQYRKVRNIERDQRVALSIESTHKAKEGQKQYLVVYGRARITEGGAPELLQRLAETYAGPGVTYPPPGSPSGYVTHITVERVAGVGPWAEGDGGKG